MPLTPSSTASTASPRGEAGEVATEFRNIQLRYNLARTTFKALLKAPANPDRRTALESACSLTTEFSAFPITQGQRGFLRHINDHTGIPYPLRESLSHPWHKAFLLVQLELQGISWPNKLSVASRKELLSDRSRIYFILDRVLRCLVDIYGQRLDGRGVVVALDVLRSVKAGTWDGGGMELLQVEGIGPAKMTKFADAGIKSIRQLSALECYHIERLIGRNPPFGQNLLRLVRRFPMLRIQVDILKKANHKAARFNSSTEAYKSSGSTTPWMTRIVLGYENENVPDWKGKSPFVTLVIEGKGGRLVWFWRGKIKQLEDDEVLIVCLEADKGEELHVVFACEEIIGTTIRESFQI